MISGCTQRPDGSNQETENEKPPEGTRPPGFEQTSCHAYFYGCTPCTG
jgi:hypothetical protein